MTFEQIPENLLVPGQYQEIDNSLAGTTSDVKKVLIIATMATTGTAEEGKAVQVLTASKARSLFGNGSPAAIMSEKFLEKNTTEELWVLPVAEPAGTAWTKTMTVTAENASEGAVVLSVNGEKVETAVAENAEAKTVAAAIVAAMNGTSNLPVEAVLDDEDDGGTTLKISANVKGVNGNLNTVSVMSASFGIKVTDGTETKGTGIPNLKTLLKELGAVRYNYIISEFADSDSVSAIAAELKDRYSAVRQIGGRCFVALSGDMGDVSTEGTMLAEAEKVNSPHIILVPRGNSVQLPCVWATVWCAMICRRLADDPSANTTDIELEGLAADEFSFSERQKLLEAGIATFRLDTMGTVLVERVVTSYTENSDGERDTSYLDMQVVETVDAIRTYINSEARKRFKTWKLASTEENFGSGAKVMTPGVWRSFLAELYQNVFIKEKQWCQDANSYIASISVSVKAGSKTRLEYIHRPVLIGQFYIGAGLNQFK